MDVAFNPCANESDDGVLHSSSEFNESELNVDENLKSQLFIKIKINDSMRNLDLTKEEAESETSI